MRHVLITEVEDHPGVLNRIASLFRKRAYNIERSLRRITRTGRVFLA